jgi:MoaA/NifB/PqqE/SkfB family radical SAM enzyme
MTYVSADKLLAHPEHLAGWARGETPAPLTIEWDLSNRCNLGCAGCHFGHTHTRGPLASRQKPSWFESTGDLADPALVARALREAAAAGVKAIVWSGGGEPLTHPQFETCLLAARAEDLKQGLYTDAALMGSQDRTALGLLEWAVVSLDAIDRASYRAYKGVDAFNKACEGVRLLRQAGVTVGVSYLLTERNWRDTWAMLELSDTLGASYTTFRPLVNVDLESPATIRGNTWAQSAAWRVRLDLLAELPNVEVSRERFDAFAAWDGSRGYDTCYGIRFNTTITPDGRLWVCPNRRGMAGSSLGDLNEESFSDIWARHPGQWTDFATCRAMCRLHFVNLTASAVFAPRAHAEFV